MRYYRLVRCMHLVSLEIFSLSSQVETWEKLAFPRYSQCFYSYDSKCGIRNILFFYEVRMEACFENFY